jgi:tetratricopeptide (TPR) repeat protein
MFTNKRYAQALVAFQRAGKSREVAICHAFLLRENARAVPDDQVKERADAFGNAGEAFYTCANTSLPDQKRERLAYFTNAAECFVQGNKWKDAGDCYNHIEQYSKAARAYRKGGHFDEMVELLEKHGNQIEPGLLAQLMKVAQMNYFKVGNLSTIRDQVTETKGP